MGWREWTGVGERRWKTSPDEDVQPSNTLWDWLQLLVVPAILIGVTFVWSATQTRSDNRREDRRIAADRAAAKEAREDATLQTYLDQMSGLMLREKLLISKRGDAVRSVARTVTLTTLRRLNGERRGEVVRFLQEARLIRGKGESRVNLAGANLTGAELTDANLADADLTDANLTDADLTGAFLGSADLADADLTGADLTDAFPVSADLMDADLTDANLLNADLTNATLTRADLTRANLTDANLTDADLTGADLADANLTDANLRGADLTDAFLLNADLTGADLTDANLRGAKGLSKERP